MTDDFLRAVVMKTAFKPEPIRRAQAALLYTALSGVEFTADAALPKEIIGDDRTLPGVAVGTLAKIGLIESGGFVRSPSVTRHGSYVQRWRLATGKAETAKTWLKRNGFDTTPVLERQAQLHLN